MKYNRNACNNKPRSKRGTGIRFGKKYPCQTPTQCPVCSKIITQARNLKSHLAHCVLNHS